ncbi:kinetochore-associated Ndc80 complex subunit NDC80 [Saccharomyces eubayanus]|uniref:kinetochore-associated Ndc80 complex subunit NDC80 n=1 Tax=Saccharomyces eubayanus TaxID=1080349 RepID=UPI0006BFCC30|nr:TID3-like protein [Saccharomyces eubayanus]KOG98761.1 TID3-like protein [Saccharomyces eubayanus]
MQSSTSTDQHVLHHMDPHRFTSQIPTASSSQLRRRNSTNPGLTDMINKSIARNTIGGTGIPTGGINKKKNSRSTVAGGTNSTALAFNDKPINSNSSNRLSINQIGNIQQHLSNRDPRPLRDKNFQNAIQEEIFDYLKKNKFDIETNHPISIKFLKQPTQKGFIIIFKWLYSRLDPGYGFTRSIENEIYQILKNLRYPFLESINKSQISAVGGSNWHKFLGMLHWLVRTNIKLDMCLNKVDRSLISQNTQEMTILNQPLKTLDEQDQRQEKYELMVEKLLIDYFTESYKSFLKLEDNYAPSMQDLKSGFEKFVHVINADISNLQNQNDTLYEKYQEVMKISQKVKTTREKWKALKSDSNKYESYVNAMKQKSQEWPSKLEKMKSECSVKKEEIKALETNIDELHKILKRKGISTEQFELQNHEREELTKELDKINFQSDKLTSSIKSRKLEAEGIFKSLLDTLRQYDLSIQNLVRSRNQLGHHVDESCLKINIPDNLLDAELHDSITYQQLLPKGSGISESIKKCILKLNDDIHERIKAIEKDNTTLEKDIKNLKYDINEKTQVNERLELELSEANSKFELSKQENERLLVAQRIEIEKMEKKISDSNLLMKTKISDAEELVTSTELKLEELKVDLNRKRYKLHQKVIHVIDVTSKFKISIQSSLENSENSLGSIIEELKHLEFDKEHQ